MWIFIGLVILVILFLELYFSFAYFPKRFGNSFYTLRKRFSVYQYDPVLGYYLTPNLRYASMQSNFKKAPRKKLYVDVRTDKNGFVFTEDLAQIKEKLIFCIGGSTTAGFEGSFDKSYPYQLDQMLKSSGYRCVNAGFGGARSIHEWLVFKNKILSFKPAAIIIFSGYNDYEAYAYNVYSPFNPYEHYLSHTLVSSACDKLLKYSSVYFRLRNLLYNRKLLSNAGKQNKAFDQAIKDPKWIFEWEKNIRKIINLASENDIKVFMLSTMSPVFRNATEKAKKFADDDIELDGRFDFWVKYVELINKAAKKICDRENATFIDVEPCFEEYLKNYDEEKYYKKRFELFNDRAHFMPLGNKLLAEAVFKGIKNSL